MARWVRRYMRVLGVVALIFVATCTSLPTTDAQYGFLSLDCGGARGNYRDDRGLLWVSDDNYISTGNSSNPQLDYPSQLPALASFRYFPQERKKYCYEIQTYDAAYLVRAMFYLDQTEFAASISFEFVMSVDATDWFTVSKGDPTSQSLLVVQESIFYPPNNVTSFCLRSISGVPFISSLELRSMNATLDSSDIYSYPASYSQYISLAVRLNCGATNTSDVRYPTDSFDRIWATPTAAVAQMYPSIHSDISIEPAIETYFEPTKVMQDAWLIGDGGLDYNIGTIFPTGPQAYVSLSEYAYVIMYFQDLNTTSSGIINLLVSFDDNLFFYANTSSQPAAYGLPFTTLLRNGGKISIKTDNLSTSPVGDLASISAIEVYGQLSYNSSITNEDDAAVIMALKALFSLTDWLGDPCVPVPHDWLSCQSNDATYGPSQGDELQSRPVFGTQFTVTSLNISDINNSNFSVLDDNSLLPAARLDGLNTMSITHSEVDDRTVVFLVNHSSVRLVTLNLSYNAVGTIPEGDAWAGSDLSGLPNLATLDLSHNNLTGMLSSFERVPFSRALRNLNLSYNSMTSFPQTWENTTINSLVTLDLSHNQFSGKISYLDEWIQMNTGTLQIFDISHNQLTGTFSYDLYFSGLPYLAHANFDNNLIDGTLNLSVWHAALYEAAGQLASKISTPPRVTQQLYSFMNNSILNIVPNAEDFDSTIHALFTNYPSSGVMLNGNPYCSRIGSSVHRYLCRPSIEDPFQDDPKKKNTTEIVIISICGGVVALLFFSFTSATLWKLWKQVRALRAIERALADRKVQPPFYHYSDIKTATRDFHNANKLGHGGFGTVYKAVFPDETLAVKKLFNSKTEQVLDEFLNEVVLITGIKHRNLVQLRGCCIKDRERMLVFEFADNGNLDEALWGPHVNVRLNWRQRIHICVGVARGLSYLHEELQPSIIHRDIKPQNILLDRDFNPKIADFGLARHFSDVTNQVHYTQLAGTLGYFAPEYAMQGQVSDKTDVYAYGILILEVISGRKCIDSERPAEEKFLKDWVFTMRRKSLGFDILQPELRRDCVVEEVDQAVNIALLCVQHNPERRPTMSQVVTMFLGNMNVEISSGDVDDSRSMFTELMATDGANEIVRTLIVQEDFPVIASSTSHSVNSNSRSDGRHIIELSAVRGR